MGEIQSLQIEARLGAPYFSAWLLGLDRNLGGK